jgi:TPR repeat protein
MKLRTIALALALGIASTSVMASTSDRGKLELGMLAFMKGDIQTASQTFLPLANNGNKYAQYYLGYMYQNGAGVDQSPAEATKWYQKAAQGGHETASYQVRVAARTLVN